MKIIDLHCDTLYRYVERGEDYSFFKNDGHISEQGLLDGDYLAQCFAVYTPTDFVGEDAYLFFKKQYSRFFELLKRSNVLFFANSSCDINRNLSKNKISAVLTVENAELLNNKIDRLYELEKCGVKVLGLIHNGDNCIGFNHSDDKEKDKLPIKQFGREVVDAVNCTDMVIDVSHLNYGGFYDVAAIAKKPFITSHSACRNLQDHSRNLYDEQIIKIAQSGGIVGLAFYSKFLNGTNKTEIIDILFHLEHLIKIGGEEVAALGTDFDGMDCELFLRNSSDMQMLSDAIIKKFGYSVAEKICYKNALRIF